MEDLKNNEPEVPEVVLEEPDDKPSGRGVIWAIVIAVIVLSLIYFFFFMDRNPENIPQREAIPADTVVFTQFSA